MLSCDLTIPPYYGYTIDMAKVGFIVEDISFLQETGPLEKGKWYTLKTYFLLSPKDDDVMYWDNVIVEPFIRKTDT